jgi:hypothetical protein
MVSYIYQYERGVKKNNIGYVRVEAKNGQCKITLHLQLLGQSDSIFPTYLIQRDDDGMELIYLGDSALKSHVMDSKLTANETNIMNSGYALSDMGGLILFLNDEIFFATEWDDKPITQKAVQDALKPNHGKKMKSEGVSISPEGHQAKMDMLQEEAEKEKVIVKVNEDAKETSDEDIESVKNRIEQNLKLVVERTAEEKYEERKEEFRNKSIAAPIKEHIAEHRIESVVENVEENVVENVVENEVENIIEHIEEQSLDSEIDLSTIGMVEEAIEQELTLSRVELDSEPNSESAVEINTEDRDVQKVDLKVESKEEVQEAAQEYKPRYRSGVLPKYVPPKSRYQERIRNTNEFMFGEQASIQSIELDTGVDLDKVEEDIKNQREEKKEEMDELMWEQTKENEKEVAQEDLEEDTLETMNFNSMEDWENTEHPQAQRIFDSYPRMYPFEDNEVILCVKIEPKDIGYLPMDAWVLSNNSFLLHGFYCYQHLIFAKIKDRFGCRYILGVPGIYNNREHFMARMFGFENFKSIRKRDLRQGEFGYWYIPIVLQ